MSSVECEGDSVEEAIGEALRQLGVDRTQADIEILNAPARSLVGGRAVRVRARLKAANVSRETTSADRERAAAFVSTLLEYLGIPAVVSMSTDHEGNSLIDIASEDGGYIIGKHGQTLDAIEYVVNRIVGGYESGVRMIVDVGGYRVRRTEYLMQLAVRLAAKAVASRRAVTLDPLSSRDRRTVHLALQGSVEVTTHSEGEGPFRHICIVPRAPAS